MSASLIAVITSFQIISLLNFLLATLCLAYSIYVLKVNRRPNVRKHAGQIALFSLMYFLIFGSRLVYMETSRRVGWIGEIGTSIAPLAFYFIWFTPLRTMHRYVMSENEHIKEVKAQSEVVSQEVKKMIENVVD